MAIDTIADRLGVSTQAVRNWITKARKALGADAVPYARHIRRRRARRRTTTDEAFDAAAQAMRAAQDHPPTITERGTDDERNHRLD
ncbi:MAG: hypothetical protein AAF772_05295 [Acidobacteriota bacterium]